jgi:hypothetical protein
MNKSPKKARMKNPTCTVVLSNLPPNRTNIRTASLRNSSQRLPKICIKGLQSDCIPIPYDGKSPYGYGNMKRGERLIDPSLHGS